MLRKRRKIAVADPAPPPPTTPSPTEQVAEDAAVQLWCEQSPPVRLNDLVTRPDKVEEVRRWLEQCWASNASATARERAPRVLSLMGPPGCSAGVSAGFSDRCAIPGAADVNRQRGWRAGASTQSFCGPAGRPADELIRGGPRTRPPRATAYATHRTTLGRAGGMHFLRRAQTTITHGANAAGRRAVAIERDEGDGDAAGGAQHDAQTAASVSAAASLRAQRARRAPRGAGGGRRSGIRGRYSIRAERAATLSLRKRSRRRRERARIATAASEPQAADSWLSQVGRNAALDIFHLMGKILHDKHARTARLPDQPSANSPEYTESVEGILERCTVDAPECIAYLHENLVDFFTNAADLSRALDALSTADMLANAWRAGVRSGTDCGSGLELRARAVLLERLPWQRAATSAFRRRSRHPTETERRASVDADTDPIEDFQSSHEDDILDSQLLEVCEQFEARQSQQHFVSPTDMS
eukprot:ctg_512.g231